MSAATGILIGIMAMGVGPGQSLGRQGGQGILWQKDFKAAAAEAYRSSRPMLIYVGASWCGACNRMKQTTLSDPAVVGMVNLHFVPLYVDADTSKKLAEQLGVQALPTTLVLSPTGELMDRMRGYKPAKDFAANLVVPLRQIAMARSRSGPAANHRELVVQQVRPATTRAPLPKKYRVVLSIDLDPDLGLNGLCPATLVEMNRLVSGHPEFSASYDGRTYQFAGPEPLRIFRENPLRYVPVLGGLCVTSSVDQGIHLPGDSRLSVVFRNRLYLFADPDRRRAFLANAMRYVDCDLAWAGQCPVCRVDEHFRIDGTPALQQMVSGTVYRFDSPQHLHSFLTWTPRYTYQSPPVIASRASQTLPAIRAAAARN